MNWRRETAQPGTRLRDGVERREREEDGCATGQPQGLGPEANLNGTPQGVRPGEARKQCDIRDHARA
ncbi:MAG: hypothetical protein JSU72_16510 [Deltaproteobacteria bacterium]|nr:MAG: hypothetical protein JSU72_16510 [Deltaproteobacteria bacterium]